MYKTWTLGVEHQSKTPKQLGGKFFFFIFFGGKLFKIYFGNWGPHKISI